MKRPLQALILLALAGLAAFWVLTAPKYSQDFVLQGLTGDPVRGELIFNVGGCASCHSAPDATPETKRILSGGRAFVSDFGTFYAPNISADPVAGIGAWQPIDLVNAMLHGTSPDRQHYFPAFPYTSYAKARVEDIVDLHAFLATLPASDIASRPHDVGFPFNIRRSLGGWKLLFLPDDWIMAEAPTAELQRGRYLVEALGHCAECHTPRNALGGLKTDLWLTGAPNPSGKGTIPNLTPDKLQWSADDLVNYFTTGFTPEFDTAGGEMVDVIENLSQLPPADLQAIAAYLLALPGTLQ